MTAIRVQDLSKSFKKGTHALRNVNLRVAKGEMVALIGASGAGKSTLIRHLVGLTTGDAGSGQVTVLGDPVQENGRLARSVRRTRSRVGVVFQQFNLVNRLSLLTNVTLGALGHVPAWRGTLGLFTAHEKRRAMEALHRVGMAEYATQRASTLSGGQQQRAAIARALVQQAEIVLADEPIASLDPESARRVMENLARINREDGITVVVSLHQVDFATRFCPRTVAMRDGCVVYDGASAALTADVLRDLYGAASEELILPGPIRAAAAAETDFGARAVPATA
ncbi:MAG: phosphonate ABC transporter ATP-binding protein [Rhodobacterales bacterium]|nr:phosphonate ABC transporter ATP-binding protein [Rhodobacterales bacterium]